MKVEIYTEVPKPREKILRLHLKSELNGDVRLLAVDGSGAVMAGGHLLTFKPDGRIIRHPTVNPQLGLRLTEEGQLAFDDR